MDMTCFVNVAEIKETTSIVTSFDSSDDHVLVAMIFSLGTHLE